MSLLKEISDRLSKPFRNKGTLIYHQFSMGCNVLQGTRVIVGNQDIGEVVSYEWDISLGQAKAIMAISEPEYIGKMPVRKDIEILPADKPKQLSLGWTVSETIGIGITNVRFFSGGFDKPIDYSIMIKKYLNKWRVN